MVKISAAQLTRIKTMMGKQGILGHAKEDMVRGFTDMRTEHVSDMYMPEAAALIQHLVKQDPNEQKAEVMRKKIIALAYQLDGLGRNASKEEKQACVRHVDEWCKKYGHKHKGLNAYTYAELPKLVTQFEINYKSTLKQL